LESLDVLIIVSSTTGDGEQPEDLTKFWRKLRPRTLPNDHLAHIQFSILGLGDTNYNQFCNGPKNLQRRLRELGGKEFYTAGWADDGVGLELVVEPWLEGLWTRLDLLLKGHDMSDPDSGQEIITKIDTGIKISTVDASGEVKLDLLSLSEPGASTGSELSVPTLLYSKKLSAVDLDLPALPPRYLEVEITETECSVSPSHQNNMKLPFSTQPIQSARVLRNLSLSSPDAVKTYMELDLEPESWFDYLPGDSVGLVCKNSKIEVLELSKKLGFGSKLDSTCTISVMNETKKARAKIPEFVSPVVGLSLLLESSLDIRSVPKKLFLRSLAEHTSSPEQKRRIHELSSKQGSEEYMKLVVEPKLGLVDFLQTFSSCQPPLSLLIENLPRLLPRYYSFSSSPSREVNKISFVYTVVDSPRPGLATSWMKTLTPGDSVQIYPRSSSGFHPPDTPDQPYIMVCAGSGLGPFLGFLEQRRALNATNSKVWLFFGCRSKDKDFLHRDKLEGYKQDGILSNLTVAFSRDDTQDGIKYVQDAVEKSGAEVSKLLLEQDAFVYVCGDAKDMGKSVYSAFSRILDTSGVDGVQYLAKMTSEKRYKQDLWT
jgi:methionine synthase reductase